MGSWGKDPTPLSKARNRACFNDEPMPGDTRLLVAYIERLEAKLRVLESGGDARDVQWDNGAGSEKPLTVP